jgi:hypothetical protein
MQAVDAAWQGGQVQLMLSFGSHKTLDYVVMLSFKQTMTNVWLHFVYLLGWPSHGLIAEVGKGF